MSEDRVKIKVFTDLNAWKEAHRLVLAVYGETKAFPKEELFGLSSQLRRAAVSITSCLAEGFSRSSWKDKRHFYSMALGSLTEVQNQLLIAKDLSYIVPEKYVDLHGLTVVVHKLINGLIKSASTHS